MGGFGTHPAIVFLPLVVSISSHYCWYSFLHWEIIPSDHLVGEADFLKFCDLGNAMLLDIKLVLQ